MRTLLTILFCLWATIVSANPGVFVGGSGKVAASTSSAFSSGAVESFEAGAGSLDTTGWTLTNPNSKISTYDTTYSKCGSHSLKVIADATTGSDNTLINDLGSDRTSLYFRVYFLAGSSFGFGSSSNFLDFTDSSGNRVAGLRFYSGGGGSYADLKIVPNDGWSAYDNIAIDATKDWIFDVYVLRNGTSTVRAQYWNGSAWAIKTTTTDVANQLSVTGSGNYPIRYVSFVDNSNDNINTLYFDAAKVDLSGSAYIGDTTCP